MMQPDALRKKDLTEAGEAPPHTSKIGSARRGFAVNVASNVIYMAVQTVTSVWFTPYLIAHLGIAAYGMWPLVNTLLAYLSVFTDSFNSAISRFLTIDLGRGDSHTANRTFNTALFGVMGIVLALTPVALALAFVFPHVFDVPPGWERDASLLFGLVALALFISVIGTNFAVSSYAHSKFLLRNLVNLAVLSARIGLAVALFSLFPARLWHVGSGVLLGAIVAFLGYVVLWHRLTPELHVHMRAFDRSRLRSLMGMGGWIVVDRAGALLLKRIDLIVVNMIFGATMTGKYGAVMQFSILINSLAITASTVTNPVIMNRYAQGDFVGLKRLAAQSVKLMGLALALPVGLLCGFSRPLLSIWLGPSFRELDLLLVFLVAHLTLNLGATPLGYVLSAFNRVRWAGIATLIAGVANLGLAIALATWSSWGVIGVALAGAIVWTAKNTFFFPIYTAHVVKAPWWTFLPSLGFGVLGTLAVAGLAYASTLVNMPDNWFTLVASAAVVSLIYLVGAGTLALNRHEWQLLKDMLPRKIQ